VYKVYKKVMIRGEFNFLEKDLLKGAFLKEKHFG
jgi:hypothetical protein